MADHLFVVTSTETRPRQIRFHVSASSVELEWDFAAVIDWLDIANARVEIRDQLRSDRLVIDAAVTLDPASETGKWTLDGALYPLRATHYKMVVVVERTDGSFVGYPADDPGFTKVVAYAEGEDPLNLESTLQQLQDATGFLGALYAAQRNPPRVLVVDKVYEGFEIEGQTFSNPIAARDYAIEYITEQGLLGKVGPVLIVLHFNDHETWSETPSDWYPGFTPTPFESLVKYYSAPRRAGKPHPEAFEALFQQSGTGDPLNIQQVAGAETILTKPVSLLRTGVGTYKLQVSTYTWTPDVDIATNVDARFVAIGFDLWPKDAGDESFAFVQNSLAGFAPTITVYDSTGNETDEWSGWLCVRYYK